MKTERDIKIGFTTFKAGVQLETVFKAIERHNKVYRELLRITPTEVTNDICKKLNT